MSASAAAAAAAPPTPILVASTPPLAKRLAPVLEGHDVVFVEHMAEAMYKFKHGKFGMVIVGVHFDQSQMFELLEQIRSAGRDPAVPIVCVLPEQHALSEVFVKGLNHAVKALMANAFLNLANYSDDPAGNGRLRRIIDYLILIDGDMQGGT
jgi:hypothetical protein